MSYGDVVDDGDGDDGDGDDDDVSDVDDDEDSDEDDDDGSPYKDSCSEICLISRWANIYQGPHQHREIFILMDIYQVRNLPKIDKGGKKKSKEKETGRVLENRLQVC